jgi:hemerythrin superfamily protein
MDALTLITAQHDLIDQLITEIEAESVIERKQLLFDELAAQIAAHAVMEEKLFYPVVLAAQTQEFLLAEDHVAIRKALSELAAIDVDDSRFDTKLAVLTEEIEHHARDEEEQIVFPKLRRLLSQEQLDALGLEMERLHARLLAKPLAA